MSERPSVAIVGAGKVGRAVGRLLAASGHEIREVVARTAGSARDAVRFVGAGRPLARPKAITADVTLVAVPDDAIAGVAARLARLETHYAGRVALHTSGARDASELSALRARGASVGSWHPLQSFASAELGVARVPGSVFGVEGDAAAVRAGRALALAVGGRPVRIRSGAKVLYHAAAVLASGGVTAVVDASVAAMTGAGMREDEALAAVLPLVLGTLANVAEVGTTLGLTGPFVRGDAGTIARNRAALAALDPRLEALYAALGDRAAEIVRRRSSSLPPRAGSRERVR